MHAKLEWRPIPGFPGYHASACGKIRGSRGGVLSPTKATRPDRQRPATYYKVGLMRGGKRYWRYVHRLVCETFRGAAPTGYTDVSHMNHDTSDNRAVNLRWSTHADNVRECFTPEAAERRAVRDEQLGEPMPDTSVPGVPF